MAKTPTTAGARDGTADAGDSPDNASVTNPAPAPETDSSAATPPSDVIQPEPFNPQFDDRNGENTPVGEGAPGLGAGGEEPRVEVETTGDFQIQDPYTLDLVPHDKSANVRDTSFIQTALADGRLKKAGE